MIQSERFYGDRGLRQRFIRADRTVVFTDDEGYISLNAWIIDRQNPIRRDTQQFAHLIDFALIPSAPVDDDGELIIE